MDVEKCQALIRVVENGNLRRTADELGYTPSGLSRMMASLEHELGLTLLVRGREGVRPTRECLELLPYLRQVAAAGASLAKASRALLGLEAGEVRIGIAYPQFYGTLLQLLADFRKLHPALQFSVREANSTPLATLMEAGELDLALVSSREGNFRWHELLEDRLVALVPLGHPLADAAVYPLARFAEDPYVEIGPGEDTDNARAFRRHGIVPNTRFTVSQEGAGRELVAAGLGVTLTNAILTATGKSAPGCVTLPTDPEVRVPIGLICPDEALMTSAARAFLAFALPCLTDVAHPLSGTSTPQARPRATGHGA